MRRSLLLLVFLSIFGFGIPAHAGTITAGVYDLNGAYVNGYSVTGTVTLNSAGNATTANLTFNNPTFNNPTFNNPGLPSFSLISFTNVYNGLSQNYLTSASNAGQVALYFNTTSDANGYFNLCLGSAQCGTSAGTQNPSALQLYGFYNSATGSNPGLANTNFSSGYLTGAGASITAVTPEPPSFILLGTGVIGLAGAAYFFKPKRYPGTTSQCGAQDR